MNIVIDFTPFLDFLELPFPVFLWRLFWLVGWLPVGITMLWGFKEVWLKYINDRWVGAQKKVFLAVDIPRGNIQSLRAVENLFAYIAGAHGTMNLIETYWIGEIQPSFSFEIVSIDGYTQFLIRTYEKFRNVVESAIYSQYPDAEITEINDYTTGMPRQFPNDEWDIFGMEFMPVKSEAYPIKTYEEFEHQFGEPETTFRDPMAALMDLYASLRKGEQIWFQIIVKPIDMNEWTAIGDTEVSKILKEKADLPKNIFDKTGDALVEWIDKFSEFIYQLWGDIETKEEKKEDALKMMNLKPKEKKQVEAIHHKISKIGFACKLRVIYWAKKELMNKPKFFGGFVGYIKQFAALDLNNLKPDMKITATKVHYFFKEARLSEKKRKIVKNYITRDGGAGRKPYILNTEELATLWHFPIEAVVKAPLIQKAPGRKAEPPMSLPIGEGTVSEELLEPVFEEEIKEEIAKKEAVAKKGKEAEKTFNFELDEETETKAKGEPPSNLPFV